TTPPGPPLSSRKEWDTPYSCQRVSGPTLRRGRRISKGSRAMRPRQNRFPQIQTNLTQQAIKRGLIGDFEVRNRRGYPPCPVNRDPVVWNCALVGAQLSRMFVPASSHFTNDKFPTSEIGAAAGSPSFFIGSISSETSAPTTSSPAERKNGS